VSAFWVVKHLDVVEHISANILPGAIDFRLIRSRFSSWKKLSATALSWQLPRRLMLPSKLLAFRKLCQSPLLNWLPWSE